ncbi:hypothetical protein GIB67_012626 [Kingdonia uniflora]|uniref:Uncharacterized protein n=1 Tax=Kingdonia uniflora TaxID=39325 RepID=A0A7J7NEP8_9MAGN|nr:hypothetical protein GIB67_012626 [Kingdonia uniflora]
MAPKKKISVKIPPTASHRNRLNSEREDPSHPNFKKSPRVPAKRSKTNSSTAKASGSVPQDPYLEKREDKHIFKKVACFTDFICSLEHIKPYYLDRVQREFNLRQLVPRNPICLKNSDLRFATEPYTYKLKYNWEDIFFGGKLRDFLIERRGRKVHNRIPVCGEGYFEWFNSVLFTKLCPAVVNLDKNDDGTILSDGGTVGGGVGGTVGGAVGGGVLYRNDVEDKNEDLCRLEEETSNLKSDVHLLKSTKEAVECERLKESYDRL